MKSFKFSSIVFLVLTIPITLAILACPNPNNSDTDQITVDISPNGRVYSELQQVSITAQPADATIMYTLDGSNPSPSSGLLYHYGSSGFFKSESGPVKAMAYKDGLQDSNIAEETYTILWWVTAYNDGSSGETYISMDGGDYWYHRNLSLSGFVNGLVTDGIDGWIGYNTAAPPAVSTTVYSSTDRAVNFSSTTLNLRITDIASDRAGTWVAVAYDGQDYIAKYSNDNGANWLDPDSFPSSGITDLLAVASDGNDTWVAVGQSGTAVYTTDWSDGPWQTGSGLSGNFFDVATNTVDDWVAVGATSGLGSAMEALAYYSTDDGATWTAASLPSDITLLRAVAAATGTNTFVAVGYDSSDVPVILYSTDGGQSFSTASHSLNSTDDLTEVLYNGYGTWMAVGDNRTLVQSTDGGQNWSIAGIAPGSSGGSSDDTLTALSFGRWEN